MRSASTGMRPRDFDSRQLHRGTWVELEHTCPRRNRCSHKSVLKARRIAMDHLAEDARYYTKLAAVHLDELNPRGELFLLGAGILGIYGLLFMVARSQQK